MELAVIKAEEVRICVLYDPSNGAIVHTHKVTTLPRGRRLDDTAMERRIRELAKSHVADAPELKVLHVNPENIVMGTNYRVDVAAGKLVEVKRKNPPQHRQPSSPNPR